MFSVRAEQIELKLRSFKDSIHINEKQNGPYSHFGYFSLVDDPFQIKKKWQVEHGTNEIYCNFENFNRVVDI